jgi:heme/copper-type cytochrome/quinol oxidase subunit 1
LLLGYFFNFLYFGKDALSFSQTFDINIYDTYFVFQSFSVVIFIIVLTTFIFYLARTIRWRYQNKWGNIMVILMIIAMLICFDSFVSQIDMFATFALEHSDKNLASFTDSSKTMSIFLNDISLCLKAFQACLLFILVFFTLKLGSNNSK